MFGWSDTNRLLVAKVYCEPVFFWLSCAMIVVIGGLVISVDTPLDVYLFLWVL